MKMNNLHMQQQINNFEQELDYREWLYFNNPEPCESELEDMERVFYKSTILKKSSHNPSNILNYQPPQGA